MAFCTPFDFGEQGTDSFKLAFSFLHIPKSRNTYETSIVLRSGDIMRIRFTKNIINRIEITDARHDSPVLMHIFAKDFSTVTSNHLNRDYTIWAKDVRTNDDCRDFASRIAGALNKGLRKARGCQLKYIFKNTPELLQLII